MPDVLKIDKVEKDKRIRIVAEWILDDYLYKDILTQIAAKWGIEERQAKRYIKDARALVNLQESENIDQKRKRKIESLKKLKRSLDVRYKGTPNGLLAILSVEREIIKIENLVPARKVEITGKDGKPIQTERIRDEIDYSLLTDDVLQAILAARKSKPDDEEHTSD